MEEQSKALTRRIRDSRFRDRWFVGRGIDIGCGPDPMKVADWPLVEEVRPYDVEFGNGDAKYMADVKDNEYDFIVSSHCLEHLTDTRVALVNWKRIIKPGGFIVCTIPDELLYECGRWPSTFNPDHKFPMTLRDHQVIPQSVNVVHLIWKLGFDIELIQLLSENWDRKKFGQDQTLGPAECAIEFVVRKPNPDLAF